MSYIYTQVQRKSIFSIKIRVHWFLGQEEDVCSSLVDNVRIDRVLVYIDIDVVSYHISDMVLGWWCDDHLSRTDNSAHILTQ